MDHFILKRGKNKNTCTVVTSHQILDEKLKSSFYIILFIIMIKPRCWKANKSVQPWQLISGWYMFLKISTLISVPVFVYYHKCFTLINLSVTWCKLIRRICYTKKFLHKTSNLPIWTWVYFKGNNGCSYFIMPTKNYLKGPKINLEVIKLIHLPNKK